VNKPILPILPLKWFPWQLATFLDRLKKDGAFIIYNQIPSFGEKLVKIDPVDPGIREGQNLDL